MKSKEKNKRLYIYLALFIALFLLIVGVVYVYSSYKNSQKKQSIVLSRKLDNFVSTSTDCSLFIAKFKDTKSNDSWVQFRVLDRLINCSIELKDYDSAFVYIDSLDSLYKKDTELRRYVSVDNLRKDVTQLRLNSQSKLQEGPKPSLREVKASEAGGP